jgi:uncharacterized protein
MAAIKPFASYEMKPDGKLSPVGPAPVESLRIGLVSDTHIPDDAKALPMAEPTKVFSGVHLIMHAGDIYDLDVLEQLSLIAPVVAAFGDDDFGRTIRDDRVQYRHVLHLAGHCIWLIHERPKAWGQPSYGDASSAGSGQRETPEVVVFGHQHRVIVDRQTSTTFINPGSPTFLNYRRGLGTVGILFLGPGNTGVQIIDLSASEEWREGRRSSVQLNTSADRTTRRAVVPVWPSN